MATLAAGKRLRSAVCATEIMVIAALDGDVRRRADDGRRGNGAPNADFAAGGSAIGKRCVNKNSSLEVLCVKAGDGSFGAVNGHLGFAQDFLLMEALQLAAAAMLSFLGIEPHQRGLARMEAEPATLPRGVAKVGAPS